MISEIPKDLPKPFQMVAEKRSDNPKHVQQYIHTINAHILEKEVFV